MNRLLKSYKKMVISFFSIITLLASISFLFLVRVISKHYPQLLSLFIWVYILLFLFIGLYFYAVLKRIHMIEKMQYQETSYIIVNKAGIISSTNIHPDFKGLPIDKVIKVEQGSTMEYLVHEACFQVTFLHSEQHKSAYVIQEGHRYIVFIQDEIQTVEQYRNIAYFDQVSQLPNRYYMQQYMEKRYQNIEQPHMTMIMITFANYQTLIDILGENHVKVIIFEFAKFLAKEIDVYPELSLFNPYDERFIVVVDDAMCQEKAVKFAKHLADMLSKPFKVLNAKYRLMVKMGMYHLNLKEERLDFSLLCERLTLALEQAKATGKTMVSYNEALNVSLKQQEEMAIDLDHAIQNDEFLVYLQPQVDLKSRKVLGFEALLRWNHPKYIHTSPMKFIALAEATHRIIDIGWMVVDKTFKMAKLLEKYNVSMSLNVSPIQFLEASFIPELIKKFESYQLKPHQIALELTESLVISNLTDVIEKMNVLRARGIDIHLDDFGMGYSSLSYLTQLPLDTLKIDQSFVKKIEEDTSSLAVVSFIIRLAQTMHLKTIVEGIETREQAEIIKRLNATLGQGYFYSKPVPFETVLHIMEEKEGFLYD